MLDKKCSESFHERSKNDLVDYIYIATVLRSFSAEYAPSSERYWRKSGSLFQSSGGEKTNTTLVTIPQADYMREEQSTGAASNYSGMEGGCQSSTKVQALQYGHVSLATYETGAVG